jgi:hypothetical protein
LPGRASFSPERVAIFFAALSILNWKSSIRPR